MGYERRWLWLGVALSGCSGQPSVQPQVSAGPPARVEDRALRPLHAALLHATQAHAGAAWQIRDGEAENREHRFTVRFPPAGAALSVSDAPPLQLQLVGADVGEPVLTGNRATYTSGDIDTWYLNGPLGLEQGFVVRAPAAPAPAAAELQLDVAVSSPWRVEASGDGVLLSAGGRRLRYDHLSAVDARGAVLAARLQATDTGITLIVNTLGAAWPIAIDPLLADEARPPDATLTALARYGAAMSTDGTTLAIGAPNADTTAGSHSGAVWLFRDQGLGWAEVAILTPNGTVANAQCGAAVAVSGPRVLVGCPTDATIAPGAGSARIFEEQAGVWTEAALLGASDHATAAQFGAAVALDGDTALVGAPAASSTGVAYASAFIGGTWVEQARLVPLAATAGARVGAAVAVRGDTALVGAPNDSSNTGAAVVFQRAAVTWSERARLTPNPLPASALLGSSVALQDNRAVAGSPGIAGLVAGSGSAQVFELITGEWRPTASLYGGVTNGLIGQAIALDGDIVVVGAPTDRTGGTTTGSAAVFALNADGWSDAQVLRASDASAGARFGSGVALTGRTAAIGAPGVGDGDAYLFDLKTTPQIDLSAAAPGLDVALTLGASWVGPVTAADAVATDWDSRRLSGLTATLLDPRDGVAETLSADVGGTGLSATWDPNTSTLTVAGDATEATYTDVARSLRLANTAGAPSVDVRHVRFDVSDGVAPSAAVTATLTPAAANQAPTIDLSGWGPGVDYSALVAAPSAGVAAVHRGAALADADNSLLSGLRATLGPTVDPTETLSVAVTDTPLSASYNAGVLSVAGTADIGTYERVLRTLRYKNTAPVPTQAPRQLAVEVTDGTAWASAASTLLWAADQQTPSLGLTTGTASAQASFVEDGGAVRCGTSNAWLEDPDSTELAAVTASLDAAFDGAFEFLSADTAGTDIVATYNPTARTLTLRGPETAARFAAVLTSLAYDNSSNDPNAADRVVQVRANDGASQSAPSLCTVSVRGTNDPPVVDLNGSVVAGIDNAVGYVENAPPTLIATGTAFVVDVDDAQLQRLTVQITDATAPDAELLAANVTGTSLSASYDAPSATLTLLGPDTVANFQDALHTVTYAHSAQYNIGAERHVAVVVDDGRAQSPVATTTVALTSVNDPPMLTASVAQTSWVEDAGPVLVDAGLQLTDADNAGLGGARFTVHVDGAEPDDVLSFEHQGVGVGQAGYANGELTWQGLTVATVTRGAGAADLIVSPTDVARTDTLQGALRRLSFDHRSDNPSAAPRTLTLSYTDPEGAKAPDATIAIAAAPVNDPPELVSPTPFGPLTVEEGHELLVPMRAVDPDTTLTYAVTPMPQNSSVDTLNGGFAWVPDFAQVGSWDLTLSASDGALTDERVVNVVVTPRDTDRDGVPDSLELALGLDPLRTDSDDDTIADAEELGDPDSPRDTDGDGIIDALDTDSDDDGYDDAVEAGDDDPSTPAIDTDLDGLSDAIDEDSDADGAPDATDLCRALPNADQADRDGDGIGDPCDDDEDGDGITNADELVLGMDPTSEDSDGDGISDRDEGTRDTDGDGLIDALDTDSDFDGIPDSEEAGDTDLGTPPVDTDGDELPDYRDADSDSDGVLDNVDNCRIVHNTDQADVNQNGGGDPCDADADGDGVPNELDLCPLVVDDQSDIDFDGRGDACDSDMDADLIPNATDNCPQTPNTDQVDRDHDGIGDLCDPEVTCGCASGAASGWLALLFMPLIWRRRR